jgi:uncharacterized membrane protein YfcA
MMVLPAWLAITIREDLLLSSFQRYYPLSVAMIFGSMIAGSTPLGGGVVAFPVSVLVIGFTSSQGRDFSLMIQSVGMTAATFLILVTKSDLLKKYGDLLVITILSNTVGLIVGMSWTISPYVVMCIYTTSVASFALILAYVETCLQQKYYQSVRKEAHQLKSEDSNTKMTERTRESSDIENTDDKKSTVTGETFAEENKIKAAESNPITRVDGLAIFVFGILGGIISSQIGTGADIFWFAYGSLIHNSRNTAQKINSNELTATSIIVMTTTSILGTTLRVSTSGVRAPTFEVYQALIACSCIVVFGAPLGSIFLSVKYQKRLKLLFYILSFVQLGSFGIIKIQNDLVAWSLVGGFLVLIIFIITFVDWFIFRTENGIRRFLLVDERLN